MTKRLTRDERARAANPSRNERAQPAKQRVSSESAAPLVPRKHTLPILRNAAQHCLACALGPPATQTVFGEGPSGARLILIGEQPGDEEDKQGRPLRRTRGAAARSRARRGGRPAR
jgi:DNA polymerase